MSIHNCYPGCPCGRSGPEAKSGRVVGGGSGETPSGGTADLMTLDLTREEIAGLIAPHDGMRPDSNETRWATYSGLDKLRTALATPNPPTETENE